MKLPSCLFGTVVELFESREPVFLALFGPSGRLPPLPPSGAPLPGLLLHFLAALLLPQPSISCTSCELILAILYELFGVPLTPHVVVVPAHEPELRGPLK